MRSPRRSASVIASKIVLTTTSVSFFEMCGVCSATSSMSPLFVICSPSSAAAPSRVRPLADSLLARLLGLRSFSREQVTERRRLAAGLLRASSFSASRSCLVVDRADRQRDLLLARVDLA